MKKKFLFVLLLATATHVLSAQDKLLELNTGLIVGQVGSDNGLGYFNISIQALYKFNRYVAAGVAYEQGGILDYDSPTSNYLGGSDIHPKLQSYGVIVKAGTDRYKRFCGYVFAGVYSTGRTDHGTTVNNSEFTVDRSGMSYKIGLGAMLNISRSMSIKLLEAGINHYSASLNYMEDQSLGGFSLDTGVVFLLLRKK